MTAGYYTVPMSDGRLPHILVCDPIHPDGIFLLRQQAELDVIGDEPLTPAELESCIGNYDALIVRSRTPLPAPILAKASRLRVIGRAGVGLDGIDLDAAAAQGITVLNTPHASTVSVAEHTLALILALAHHVVTADRSLKDGRWAKNELKGICLIGKTLGIIGFGRIGQQVARRALAFDMQVITNQPRPTSQLEERLNVEMVDLYDLLPAADFITLHVPLRPENVGLIGARELALMKPTAYLVNTSRGAIVDEAALLAALNDGRLAGAGLDVFHHEPDINPNLACHPQVIATPHIAATTEDAQQEAGLYIAEQVLSHLRQ
jgi:D-3-phosphoglycerate dehydrogenase / 2-oxoglutarate reductase